MTSPFGKFDPQVVRDPQARGFFPVAELLEEELPDIGELLFYVAMEQQALAPQLLTNDDVPYALRIIVAQALNDFIGLLADLGEGSGRSAMRAARALVEHGVNAHTVAASDTDAQRYLDHLDQARAIVWSLEPGADLLPAAERRGYRHRLRKAGQVAQRRFDAAIARYGSPFRRGWNTSNLRDRANQFGLGDLYDYYRLGSLVAHGAAGGSLGMSRDPEPGLTTFRIGPALELAPIAYLAGLRGYREVLRATQSSTPALNVQAFSVALDGLTEVWPEYYAAIRKLDESLWPDHPVHPPITVFAFARNREERWFIHLPHQGLLIPAERPAIPSETEATLAKLVDDVLAHKQHMFSGTQRFVATAIPGLTVKPLGEKRPIPDTAVLVVPETELGGNFLPFKFGAPG